ncbi:MAG: hypothetical protein KF758_14110 [Anaerolineales bacterium]|nr:hypothetical protein [Anaerolineales bacterium]
MKKQVYLKPFVFIFIISSFLSGCANVFAPATPTPNLAVTEQVLSIQQTQFALDVTVQAQQATQTQAALATPTPLPTQTPLPSPTSTPGPIIIEDDFSTNTGRWTECGQCVIENGVMKMGPYPISNDGGGYFAICSDCGTPQDYKMGVDATFVDGYTDRGFGLLIREDGGSYVDIEITTWQVYGAWFFDNSRNVWGNLLKNGWELTGSLRPSAATNRLEVELISSGGNSTIHIKINGQLVNTAEIPAVRGRVGLIVGLHSLGVIFDNFYFEGYPIQPPGNQSPSENSG